MDILETRAECAARPSDTTIAKRSVHQAVLRENGVMEQAGSASAEPEPAATNEADDFLF